MRLFRHELGVDAIARHQLTVAAGFSNPALVQNQDSVAVNDTGKSVGQDKGGAALHQPVQGLLDESLVFGIDCRQRFIKNQNR